MTILSRDLAKTASYLDSDRAVRAAVQAAVHDAELPRAQHLVREDLVHLRHLRRAPRRALPLPAALALPSLRFCACFCCKVGIQS